MLADLHRQREPEPPLIGGRRWAGGRDRMLSRIVLQNRSSWSCTAGAEVP